MMTFDIPKAGIRESVDKDQRDHNPRAKKKIQPSATCHKIRLYIIRAYLSCPNKQQTTTPSNVLAIPQALNGNDVDGVSSIYTAIGHDGDKHVFFHVEGTRVKETGLRNNLLHDLAKRKADQLDHQRCDNHSVLSEPKELVDKGQCTAKDNRKEPHAKSVYG